MRRAEEAAKRAEAAQYVTVDLDILKNIFDKFDKDKSGFLEKEECHAALTHLGSALKYEDLDTDADGKISFEEFAVFSELMGKHTHPIFKNKSTVTSTANASSTGTSVWAGSAHKNEVFLRTASKCMRRVAPKLREAGCDEQSIAKAFRDLDIDRDGSLDPHELLGAVKKIAPQLTAPEVSIMLKCADKDADGSITFEEFREIVSFGADADVDAWNKYGVRDMHTNTVKDRKHQVRY